MLAHKDLSASYFTMDGEYRRTTHKQRYGFGKLPSRVIQMLSSIWADSIAMV